MESPVAWHLLVYRLPAQPSSSRVAIWRELRRLGAVPLQQCCVIVPETAGLEARIRDIADRVVGMDGDVFRFRVSDLPADVEQRLIATCNGLRSQEYAEIAEECETKFAKEVEFEIFRDNLTSAEAEELEADLDKIRSWFQRVVDRDWFGADGRVEAEAGIATSSALLDDFIERAYRREADEGPSFEPPRDLPWGTHEGATGARPLIPIRKRRGSTGAGRDRHQGTAS